MTTSQTPAKDALRAALNHTVMVGQAAAKWLPREKSAQKKLAGEIRQFFGMSPSFYRKSLAELSDTVENKMCANQFTEIDFSHVPSLAASRYKKAFLRNAPEQFAAYVAALVAKDPSVKINAGAVFPYDVIGDWQQCLHNSTLRGHMVAQWGALPNYVGNASILPLVDVSGSMSISAGDSSVTCMDVAMSLGLYCSEKNTGKFKDVICTFSESPQLVHLTGDVVDRLDQLSDADWGMNTDLIKAFERILHVATEGQVPPSEMPAILLILSDMAFDDACDGFDDTAMQAIARRYTAAGYTVPKVVFWNLSDKGNVPVKCNDHGAALVSGFSPAIVASILSTDPDMFTPTGVMLTTLIVDKYNW